MSCCCRTGKGSLTPSGRVGGVLLEKMELEEDLAGGKGSYSERQCVMNSIPGREQLPHRSGDARGHLQGMTIDRVTKTQHAGGEKRRHNQRKGWIAFYNFFFFLVT